MYHRRYWMPRRRSWMIRRCRFAMSSRTRSIHSCGCLLTHHCIEVAIAVFAHAVLVLLSLVFEDIF